MRATTPHVKIVQRGVIAVYIFFYYYERRHQGSKIREWRTLTVNIENAPPNAFRRKLWAATAEEAYEP